MKQGDLPFANRQPNDRMLAIAWTCLCDTEQFIEAMNVHAVECAVCGRKYELGTNVALLPYVNGFRTHIGHDDGEDPMVRPPR